MTPFGCPALQLKFVFHRALKIFLVFHSILEHSASYFDTFFPTPPDLSALRSTKRPPAFYPDLPT